MNAGRKQGWATPSRYLTAPPRRAAGVGASGVAVCRRSVARFVAGMKAPAISLMDDIVARIDLALLNPGRSDRRSGTGGQLWRVAHAGARGAAATGRPGPDPPPSAQGRNRVPTHAGRVSGDSGGSCQAGRPGPRPCRAAAAGGGGRAALERASVACQAHAAARADGDPDGCCHLDRRFRACVALAADNAVLVDFVRTDARKRRACCRARWRYTGVIAASPADHRANARLSFARNTAGAGALMARHGQLDQVTAMDLLAAWP